MLNPTNIEDANMVGDVLLQIDCIRKAEYSYDGFGCSVLFCWSSPVADMGTPLCDCMVNSIVCDDGCVWMNWLWICVYCGCGDNGLMEIGYGTSISENLNDTDNLLWRFESIW